VKAYRGDHVARVMQALRGGINAKVAVTYFEWPVRTTRSHRAVAADRRS